MEEKKIEFSIAEFGLRLVERNAAQIKYSCYDVLINYNF